MEKSNGETIYVYVVRGRAGFASRVRRGLIAYAEDMERGTRLGYELVVSFRTGSADVAGRIMGLCDEFSRGQITSDDLNRMVEEFASQSAR